MDYDTFIQRYEHNPKEHLRFGGKGEVYKGFDHKRGFEVAIKRAQVKSGQDRYSVFNEFELGKTLIHPNLAKYFDVYRLPTKLGTFDYGIMEFIEDGANLDDFIITFPDEAAIDSVLIGILEGLSYLHQNRVIHRDIKPNNILIVNLHSHPSPKIIDFGVSKELKSSETAASAIVGTFEFMAPEQINPKPNQKMKPNVDLWSFGVLVYRIFTGEMPFGSVDNGDTRDEIYNRVLDAKVPTDVENVPEPYQSLIKLCLVKEPSKRVKSAGPLIRILKRGNKIDKNENEKMTNSTLAGISAFSTSLPSWAWIAGGLLILLLLYFIAR